MKINKKIIGFSLLYFSTVAIFVILFFSLKSNSVTAPEISRGGNNKIEQNLIRESELLMSRLKQLQKLDKRYAALFIQSEVTSAMDSVDTEIAAQEYIFSNIIDSFDRVKSNSPGEDKLLSDRIDTFFRQALESRRTIGNIRYALAAGNFDLDSNQKKWLKLNSELIAKDERIYELQNLLSINKSSTGGTDLAGENLQLKAALTEQVKKYNELTNSNNSLKQNLRAISSANRKVQQPQEESGNREEKNALTENTNAELNAEIQLARISCNLARADVKQIISNSKQRKELLSEALTVLNALAKSNDPVIQNKAKGKLNELYKISETIRD